MFSAQVINGNIGLPAQRDRWKSFLLATYMNAEYIGFGYIEDVDGNWSFILIPGHVRQKIDTHTQAHSSQDLRGSPKDLDSGAASRIQNCNLNGWPQIDYIHLGVKLYAIYE